MQQGGDERTRADIAEYGCTIMHVMGEGSSPPFAYTIGITAQTGAPEVVVVGLTQPMAHWIMNEYNGRIKSGEGVKVGEFHSGFIEGFDVFVEVVPQLAYDDYFGQAIDFYAGRKFKVVQIIYPTTEGVWPWDEGAPQSFQTWQPILARFGRA